MRLLILSNMGPNKFNPSFGRFVYNQYAALKEKAPEDDIEYFYLKPFSSTSLFGSLLNKLKYPVFALVFFWRYIFSVKNLDIIHVHFYYPTILLAWLYKKFRHPGVKLVVTFHGSDIYKYQRPGRWYRRCLANVDKVVFTSKTLKEKLAVKWTGDYDILSAGISDAFCMDEARQSPRPVDVVFVGRLDDNKGKDRLLRLLETSQKSLNVVVVGQGDGAWVDQFKQQTQHTVRYYASRSTDELVSLFRQSKILLSLSRHESFGLVMAEAMACGCVVMATKTDGSVEQIDDQANGVLLENCDNWLHENLANRVTSLLASDYFASIQQAGQQSSQRYYLSDICDKLLLMYRNLIY